MSKDKGKKVSAGRGSVSPLKRGEDVRTMTEDALARTAGFPDAKAMNISNDKPTVAAVIAIAARVAAGKKWSVEDAVAGIECHGAGGRQQKEVAVLMSRAYQRGQLLIAELASAWQIEAEADYGEAWLRDFTAICKGSSLNLSHFEGKLSKEHQALRSNPLKYLTVKSADNGTAIEAVVMERRDPNAKDIINLKELRDKVVSRVGSFCDAVALKGGTEEAQRKAFDLLEKAIVEEIDEHRDALTERVVAASPKAADQSEDTTGAATSDDEADTE